MGQLYRKSYFTYQGGLVDEEQPAMFNDVDYVYLLIRGKEEDIRDDFSINIYCSDGMTVRTILWYDGTVYRQKGTNVSTQEKYTTFIMPVNYADVPFTRVIDGVTYKQFWVKIFTPKNKLGNVSIPTALNEHIVEVYYHAPKGNLGIYFNKLPNCKVVREITVYNMESNYWNRKFGNSSVEEVGVVNVNTQYNKAMSCGFAGATNLKRVKEINLTTNLNDFNLYSMFSDCTSLTDIPLFDTSAVTSMSSMFSNCTSLTDIPLFDTSAVTSMKGMFSGSGITEIPQLDYSNVVYGNNMFKGCKSLTNAVLFNTSNMTSMNSMFRNCSNLQRLELNDMSKVTDMDYFVDCYSDGSSNINRVLTTVILPDMPLVKTASYAFQGCYNITSITPINMPSLNVTPSRFLRFEGEELIITSFASLQYGATECISGSFSKITFGNLDSMIEWRGLVAFAYYVTEFNLPYMPNLKTARAMFREMRLTQTPALSQIAPNLEGSNALYQLVCNYQQEVVIGEIDCSKITGFSDIALNSSWQVKTAYLKNLNTSINISPTGSNYGRLTHLTYECINWIIANAMQQEPGVTKTIQVGQERLNSGLIDIATANAKGFDVVA